MSGYTPLFQSLTTGTLCGKWPDIGLWPIVLSLADRHGVVDVTPAYLAGVTGLPVAEVEACMERFCQPDKYSRSSEAGGARLQLIEPDNRNWGWIVVNHGKYREKARLQSKDAARTASGQDAERKRAERASVPRCPPESPAIPLSYKTETRQDKREEARASVPHGTFDGWAFVESRMMPHYPEGRFKQPDWIQASRIVEMLVIERGEDPELIAANVKLFRTEQDLDGNTGTKFVKKPSNWLADGSWKGPFHTTPQVAESPEKARMREAEAREWADLRARGQRSGFRAPGEGESQGAYRTLLQRHEAAISDQRKNTTGPAPIAALLPTRASA